MQTCEVECSTSTQKPARKTQQEHFRVAEADIPSHDFRADFIQDVNELERLKAGWERLTETSLRSNPFFDADFLIPALKHFGNNKVSVLVVTARPRSNPNGQDVLCALLPLHKRRFYGLPLTCAEVWQHDQCFDCTPLIRKDCASEVLDFIFEVIHRQYQASLFSLNTVSCEGDFASLLTDNLADQDRTVFHRDHFTRACFVPMQDAETYINTKVAKNTRKGTQRLRRKLADSAAEPSTAYSQPDDAHWIEDYLSLEAAGWKGKAGSAFACDPAAKCFFVEMATRMMQSGKMRIAKTMFQNKPIAIACDLVQGQRAAHFKTTFDESLHTYSPGLMLELDNIAEWHNRQIRFVDSCADPQHSMINRVWPDRTHYQSLVVALGGFLPGLAVATMPLFQHLSKLIKKNR